MLKEDQCYGKSLDKAFSMGSARMLVGAMTVY